ncbi:hypothetical protein C8J57DRAFT_152675 [Mycena rebaudengoi]|nr:hypothetical protein C8J57DRAFT_152675 [Mycena rebaudengoi]
MSNFAIVDDQSSKITYTGLWTGGGTGDHYDNTATSSRVAGASMTFEFSGTFISVLGSFDADSSCSASFSVDANATSFVSPLLTTPLNHQSLWDSGPLPDAAHTLTYTIAKCDSSNSGYVWIDYLLYIPSTNASTNGLVYFVDDTDSRIQYAGDWKVETNATTDFGLSIHGGKQGSSFQYEFFGTSISVRGRIGNDSVGASTQASFSIDGSTPVVFSAPYQNSVSYNQQLFKSDSLNKSTHTLVATAMSSLMPLYVDYLLVQPGPSTSDIPVSPAHHSGFPVVGIAAVAAGGFVLALGIAVVVFFRKRLFKPRHRRTTPSQPHQLLGSRGGTPTISSSSSHAQWQSNSPSYPPTITSSSYSLSAPPLSPAYTPPVSPMTHSFPPSSSASSSRTASDHRTSQPPPSPWSTSFASSSGHSRRAPSLADGDPSFVDLKRRQHVAPVTDDSSSGIAPSSTSSIRPLPVIPTGRPPKADPDEAPPVYSLQ